MSEADSSSEPRREFFRVDDQVLLNLRPIDAAGALEVAERIADRVPDRFTVAANFAVNSRAMARLLHGVSSNTPEVARYLKLMDQKLNHLARLFMLDEVERGDYPRVDVNISAGGLVFPSQQAFAPDDLLEMRLILYPSLTGILTVARVIYCEPNTDAAGAPWRVAVEYAHIRESDRDLLCSHIIARETELLRRQRGEVPE